MLPFLDGLDITHHKNLLNRQSHGGHGGTVRMELHLLQDAKDIIRSKRCTCLLSQLHQSPIFFLGKSKGTGSI